jgi:radical SAM superfamily enzyme YgiQ (UPF0313 family)
LNHIRKKPRLLLINPWIYDFTAYDFWSKPLGLLYIASILRKIGYHIDFIDCMDRYDPELLKIQNRILPEIDQDGTGPFYKVKIAKPKILQDIPRNYSRYGITEEIFHEKIKLISKPDVVLITSIMSYWYPGVFRVIELIKKRFPDCPVILGGIYARLCHEHAVEFSGAGYVLKHFQLSHLKELLDNLCSVRTDQVFAKNYFKYLDHYPYPAWDLYQDLDYVCLITTRGCPFRCSYCASYLINPEPEFRSPHHVVEEIIHWKEAKGIDHFVFYDDALLVNAGLHFVPFMKTLEKQNLNVNFYTPNALHARLITKPIAQLMIKNGFKKIWLGFETADYKLQKITGGKIDNVLFKKAIEILSGEGFSKEQIRAYVLIGLPGQSLKSMIDSIYFVMDAGIKPYLAKFSPIPGTRMWNQVIKEYGWKGSTDPLWHNDALMPYYSSSINPQQYHYLKTLIQHFKI